MDIYIYRERDIQRSLYSAEETVVSFFGRLSSRVLLLMNDKIAEKSCDSTLWFQR